MLFLGKTIVGRADKNLGRKKSRRRERLKQTENDGERESTL
jgi:hypothetical protein